MSKNLKSFVRPLFTTRASFDSATVNIVLATDIFDKELNDPQEPLGQGFEEEVDQDPHGL
jgi:hypothetical protein